MTCLIIVGFGINTPEHAKLILDSGVDGIIVASKLIDKIRDQEIMKHGCFNK
jgi:tryptophan synthase alpha subunit